MGWTGTAEELYGFLSMVGCDQTNGKFHVDGEIVSLLGMGQDFVVGDRAVYYVAGKPIPLAASLVGTSYGVKVKVI